MDLSALIFVALAVAWAVYLIPKALRHHDEVQRSRSVERFSKGMRVLARREPVSRRDARLVVSPGRTASVPVIETKGPEPVVAALAARREASIRATKRRRNVLTLILVALVAVAGVAGARLIDWWYVAIPGGLLVAWLIACRVMVRKEHAVPLPRRTTEPAGAATSVVTEGGEVSVEPDSTETSANLPLVEAAVVPDSVTTDPSMWDMIPVTLPTYVSKPAAVRRSVQTIDLDSTGVWTSGHTEADSALARAAEDAAKEEAEVAAEEQRAVGS